MNSGTVFISTHQEKSSITTTDWTHLRPDCQTLPSISASTEQICHVLLFCIVPGSLYTRWKENLLWVKDVKFIFAVMYVSRECSRRFCLDYRLLDNKSLDNDPA